MFKDTPQRRLVKEYRFFDVVTDDAGKNRIVMKLNKNNNLFVYKQTLLGPAYQFLKQVN